MTDLLTISGAASALLLAAALLCGARADVTTEQCKVLGKPWPVRRYPTDNATRLWINACRITKLNVHDFTGLPNLRIVSLGDNDITNLNTSVFRAVPTLNNLYLYGNKLGVLPVFGEASCPSLTSVYLSNNRLKVIRKRTFSACGKLRFLDLSNNQIEYLHPKAFAPLIQLETVYLNYNKISLLSDSMFAGKLKFLSISNNKMNYLPSNFAKKVKLISPSFGVFLFDGNPWFCACLLELLADVKRSGVGRYGAENYNGTWQMCVLTAQSSCQRQSKAEHKSVKPLIVN